MNFFKQHNYDSGASSRTLEMTLPRELMKKVGPYEIFIQNFLTNIAQDPHFSEDKWNLRELSLSMSNTHKYQDVTRTKNFSFAELMGENWEQIERHYDKAVTTCKGAHNKFPDLRNSDHRFVYEDIAEALEMVMGTVDFIKQYR